MFQGGLLTVHPGSIHGGGEAPAGRVLGRGLLVLPILEARRRRNRGEIVKKGSVFEGFGTRGIYRRRGGSQRWTRGPRRPPWRDLGGGRARWPPGPPLAPLWTHL